MWSKAAIFRALGGCIGRAFSFANRCIDVWNNLENDIVTAPSLYSFKAGLKGIDFSKFMFVV